MNLVADAIFLMEPEYFGNSFWSLF